MEAVRQWAFSLCAAALVCAVIELLLPSVPLTKMVRLSLSVFFLCVLIQPIGLERFRDGVALQSRQGMTQAEKVADALSSRMQDDLSGVVGRSVKESLASLGIAPEEYHLEISLGEGTVLATVLLDEHCSAAEADIIRCLEQDPLIRASVIREGAK